jgi:sensor c-di-GMP phosphodiesterase-like protein
MRPERSIRAFQASGFEVAIDVFGTGYSSLAYLQRFRVKQLKIDRFFTNGLDTHGQEGGAIVSAIIALAHSLQMDVVTEGVETASQHDKQEDRALRRDAGVPARQAVDGRRVRHAAARADGPRVTGTRRTSKP